jgi:hypothetical protein
MPPSTNAKEVPQPPAQFLLDDRETLDKEKPSDRNLFMRRAEGWKRKKNPWRTRRIKTEGIAG